MRHQIRKFFGTLQIAGWIIMARTFGRYIHSGWDGYSEFALYEWRGEQVRIPTGHHV